MQYPIFFWRSFISSTMFPLSFAPLKNSSHKISEFPLTRGVEEIIKTGDSILFTFTTQDTLCKQIVKKGSVAIDGISLTVFDTNKNTFKIAVIPHTFDNTCIKFYKKGFFDILRFFQKGDSP